MEEIFSKLVGIPGVMSITVIAQSGEVVCHKAADDQSPFDTGSIIPSIEEIGYLLDFLGDSGGPEIVLQGSSVQAYLKRDAGIIVALLVERTANLAAVYVTLNSSLPKLRAMLASGGSGNRQSQSDQGSAAPMVRFRPAMASPAAEAKPMKAASVTTNAPRLKQVSLVGDWDAGRVPADAVGLEFVNHLYLSCEAFMGDATRETVVREMKILGVSPSTLNVRVVQDLIERVVSNIEDPRARRELRSKILGD